jgi:hypothetical protein
MTGNVCRLILHPRNPVTCLNKGLEQGEVKLVSDCSAKTQMNAALPEVTGRNAHYILTESLHSFPLSLEAKATIASFNILYNSLLICIPPFDTIYSELLTAR